MPKIIKVTERLKIAKRITWIGKFIFLILSVSCFVGCNRLATKMNEEEKVKVTITGKSYTAYESGPIFEIDYKIDGQEREHTIDITKDSYDRAKIGGHQYYTLTKDYIYDSYYFYPLFCGILLILGCIFTIIMFAFSIDPRDMDTKEKIIS